MTNEERFGLTRLLQLQADETTVHTAADVWVSRAHVAWNAIKKPEDSVWNDLPMEMRRKLVHLAEKALSGRSEAEGDYAPEGFFAKVRELSDGAKGLNALLKDRTLVGHERVGLISGDPIADVNSYGVGLDHGQEIDPLNRATAEDSALIASGPLNDGYLYNGEERRIGLASRRITEAHLNLSHFPGSERRAGMPDRRGYNAMPPGTVPTIDDKPKESPKTK